MSSRSRVTALAGGLSVLLPTADVKKGTGFDTWVVSPAILFVTNPTNLFPINLIVRYNRSLGDIGGSSGPILPVNTLELTLQTFHLLPRGFFLAVLPTAIVDLDQNFEVYSLAAGLGKALNRQLALKFAFVHRVFGQNTFRSGVQFGVNYLWGRDKGLR